MRRRRRRMMMMMMHEVMVQWRLALLGTTTKPPD